MTDKELMQQALKALTNTSGYNVGDEMLRAETLKELRDRLAQPEQKPVAYVQQEVFGRGQVLWMKPDSEFEDGAPLYTAPPQREWQSLTDEEVDEAISEANSMGLKSAFRDLVARAIEAKLRKKNG